MSEEKKDLGDKADEAMDKAKDVAKEAAEEVKEAAGKAKEKAAEFAEDAKEAANDFKEDVKEAFSPDNPDSGKTVAIIAHITLIGWIIAVIMNGSNKTEIGSFYIRQTLGIFLLFFLISFIPFVNLIAWILGLVVWVMSLVGALNGTQKPIFLLGTQFQEWFKAL